MSYLQCQLINIKKSVGHVSYDEHASPLNRHDDTVDPHDLEKGEPGIRLPGIVDHWDLNHGGDHGEDKISPIAFPAMEISPVCGEAQDDLNQQYNCNDRLGMV